MQRWHIASFEQVMVLSVCRLHFPVARLQVSFSQNAPEPHCRLTSPC